ncbi:MAG: hypothetical protein AMXMBFR26_16180 [Porticoccaceae bacterium]
MRCGGGGIASVAMGAQPVKQPASHRLGRVMIAGLRHLGMGLAPTVPVAAVGQMGTGLQVGPA